MTFARPVPTHYCAPATELSGCTMRTSRPSWCPCRPRASSSPYCPSCTFCLMPRFTGLVRQLPRCWGYRYYVDLAAVPSKPSSSGSPVHKDWLPIPCPSALEVLGSADVAVHFEDAMIYWRRRKMLASSLCGAVS
jgi:hypothetical protein